MLLFASALPFGPLKHVPVPSPTRTRIHPPLAIHNELLEKRRRTMQILRRDLDRQYVSPRALDWTIYDDYIVFDDPMTMLSGKFQYRGMILTIGLFIVRFLFKSGTAKFNLTKCELTDDLEKIRTLFETTGITKWGSSVTISGEDFFWFGKDSHLIARHQSTWDQKPEQVMDAFWGRKS